MAYAFRRAARAMAITSSTTAVAFMGNMASDLLPIRVFGIFAAIIVLVNYLLAIFFFPSAIIIYEEKIEHRWSCLKWCLDKKGKRKERDGEQE